MNNPKISIIVPVYKTEEYLPRCLDSLTGQTYQNIEIVCVNDGSPDRCGEILKEYKKNDDRIRVITKQNEGLSAARNDGMKAAFGEYVMFVDSDDWVDADICAVMYDAIIENEADSCMCCYVKEFENHASMEHIFEGDTVMAGNIFEERFYRRLFGLYKDELRHPESFESIVSACMQLFKREMVDGIEFIDTKLIGTEDLMFQIFAYKHCHRLVYIDRPMYHYRKTNAGSLTSTHKPMLCEQRERMFSMMEGFIKENNLPHIYNAALSNRVALSMIGIGLNECVADKSIFKKAKRLKEVLNTPRFKDAFETLDFSYFPIHWKVFFGLCKYRLSMLLVFMVCIIEFLRKRI